MFPDQARRNAITGQIPIMAESFAVVYIVTLIILGHEVKLFVG